MDLAVSDGVKGTSCDGHRVRIRQAVKFDQRYAAIGGVVIGGQGAFDDQIRRRAFRPGFPNPRRADPYGAANRVRSFAASFIPHLAGESGGCRRIPARKRDSGFASRKSGDDRALWFGGGDAPPQISDQGVARLKPEEPVHAAQIRRGDQHHYDRTARLRQPLHHCASRLESRRRFPLRCFVTVYDNQLRHRAAPSWPFPNHLKCSIYVLSKKLRGMR